MAEKIARPPNKWYKSCINIANKHKDPNMDAESECMVYWNELGKLEQASIWIEGLEICERPCQSLEKKRESKK